MMIHYDDLMRYAVLQRQSRVVLRSRRFLAFSFCVLGRMLVFGSVELMLQYVVQRGKALKRIAFCLVLESLIRLSHPFFVSMSVVLSLCFLSL